MHWQVDTSLDTALLTNGCVPERETCTDGGYRTTLGCGHTDAHLISRRSYNEHGLERQAPTPSPNHYASADKPGDGTDPKTNQTVTIIKQECVDAAAYFFDMKIVDVRSAS